MPGSSLGAGIWESSSQGRSLRSGPKARAPPRLAVLLRVGFCLGAVSIDTALPVSRLPLPSVGLMPSEHHVPLQPLNVSLPEVWWRAEHSASSDGKEWSPPLLAEVAQELT